MTALTVARSAFGALLLVAPGAIIGPIETRSDRGPRAIARVLGARHLVQAALVGRHRSPALAIGGAGVDSIHAAVAVAVAAVDARHRRVALANAATAAALAASGVHEARHAA